MSFIDAFHDKHRQMCYFDYQCFNTHYNWDWTNLFYHLESDSSF